MNKIAKAFENGKAFAAFFICGDPDLASTASAIRAAVAGGADMIELNIPFSDPTAGDAGIQEANIRALAGGVTTDQIFQLVRELRRDVHVPFIISGYANVVFSYGAERFMKMCSETGVDGLIVPDLPFEERYEFLDACNAYGVDLIYMLAVTSKERVAMIAREAKGFLYIMACPGTREQELCELMEQVRGNTQVPCLICLTGTEKIRFQSVAEKTDGVIVDEPIVSLMGAHGAASAAYVGEYAREMKKLLQQSE